MDVAAANLVRTLLTEEHGIVVMRSAADPSAGTDRTTPFARALIEAVSGRAATDGEGMVSFEEFARFVVVRVRELSAGAERAVVERPHGMRTFSLVRPPNATAPARGVPPP